jgi:hypothetical protein
MPEERTSTMDPVLRPVTVGFVLTRFGCIVMVRINRQAIAAELLLSYQFSFGINGGVQQVILACIIALEINPSWLMLDLDSKNAHTFCSRDRLEEDVEINVAYHYMLESAFPALYGKTVTVQWHFGMAQTDRRRVSTCRARGSSRVVLKRRFILTCWQRGSIGSNFGFWTEEACCLQSRTT